MVKTTPDETDYVKSGVYKINQSVQIVDATPQTDIIKFITSTVYIMLNPNMSIYNLQTPKNR